MGKGNLSPRLQAVAELMVPRSCVADVGCDHGYLIAALVESGKAQRGIACDLRTGPLSRARETLARRGLLDQVELVLTDGLTGLQDQGIDGVILAGMGGDLMAEILEGAPWVQSPQVHLVLQPMSKPQALRQYLAQRGFAVLQERALEDGGHLYTAMAARWDGVQRTLTPLEALAGRLPEHRDSNAIQLLLHLAKVQEHRGRGLAQGGQTAEAQQALALAAQLRDLAEEGTDREQGGVCNGNSTAGL